MNADWDDAPSRVQRKAGNAIRWCVSLVFGLCITGGGLYLASGQMKPNPRAEAQVARLNAEAIRKHNEEVRARQLANQQRYQPSPMEEKNWIRSSDVAQRSAQARIQEPGNNERQTSFNDANYVPQGNLNIMPAPAVPVEPARPIQRKKEIVVVGKADTRLRDYCPHPQGSIELRNCKMQMDLWERNKRKLK